MKIKKTHTQGNKKYNVIITIDNKIMNNAIYPTLFKEVNMSTKAPEWFTNWSKSFEYKNDQRWEMQENFNKKQFEFNKRLESKVDKNSNDILGIKTDVSMLKKDVSMLKMDVLMLKKDVSTLKNDVKDIMQCPTIQKELNQ